MCVDDRHVVDRIGVSHGPAVEPGDGAVGQPDIARTIGPIAVAPAATARSSAIQSDRSGSRCIDTVGPHEVMELLEIEGEDGAQFVRRGLGHQHRLSLEGGGQLDDESVPGVVRAPQAVESVAPARRASCRRRRCDRAPAHGSDDDTARLDRHMASEFIRSSAGHRHPTLERRHQDRPNAAGGSSPRRRRIGECRRRLRRVRDHVVVRNRHVLASTVVPTLTHLRRGVVFAAAVRTRDRHDSTLPNHPGNRTHVRSPPALRSALT